ncbi:MAG: hypothetical protein UT48_C0008G0021 [Parcubacteria group bacterium GW2011_GWE2_39_37]|uniref:Uncharacterized protein n=1 Tax=Candidatus Falkowbacteria bacterium GW2011_GWF2_39_8 TaxID=1618642 RepID=A0A0G0T0K3_9BACT|nr:MAG: hypothetical protein UT48_C0008G0021 [Parcubacteria group bacterium GW2011_GWE2_39_37]KKR31377.1 MAG: hypothetical protein UT64_C0062G0008 [Candidatus Falkowbacteria bacterium GW2011_GWF2_39_8]
MKLKEETKKPKKITKAKTKQVTSIAAETRISEKKEIKINKGPLRLNEFIETNPSLWCISWALMWRAMVLCLSMYISIILLISFASLMISSIFQLSA